MSRLVGKLSALKVKRAALRGIYGDGAGLVLQIARGGSKSWLLRYRMNGRRRHLGLGGYPTVSLAEARDLAADARRTLRDGRDPIEVKGSRRARSALNATTTMSFRESAERYIDAHAAGWKPKSTKQWRASLAGHAFPVIGALPVEAIDTGFVLKVVEPIWKTKNETADRVRGRIEAVLDWAKTRGYRTGENPAKWKGHLANLLPSTTKVAQVEHHAALAYDQMPAFMAALRAYPGTAGRALEFLILTAARSGEVFGARWEEIDLQAKVWTVPGARMKSGRDHRVALSSEAAAILSALPGREGIIFQAPRAGYPLAKMALGNVLKRMGRAGDATPHGFRSAFRDWAGDRTAFARDVIEAALAHAIGDKTEAAYRRSDALEKRRMLMQTWSDFCNGKATADVIPLRRPA